MLLLLIQVVCRYKVDKKYDLKHTFEDVDEFRLNAEVVGEDNDYEVTFIRTYKEIMSEKWWNVIWIAYIASLCAISLIF